MSVRASLIRHNLILERLRRSPASLEEIAAFIAERTGIEHQEERPSRRTFIRDKDDILVLYGIEITYDRSDRRYRIEDSGHRNLSNRLLEAFDIMNLLRTAEDRGNHLMLETRRPTGTEHFSVLEKAIREQQELRFSYLSYETGQRAQRQVKPYALKEFKGRWYLLAQRGAAPGLRTYGLDRIGDPEVLKSRFVRSVPFDPEHYFRDYFGITGYHENGIQDIELRFDSLQGRYVTSLPLHASQEVLSDDEQGVRIRLRLYVTHDFIMELLSYGRRMEVLAPASLRERIRAEHQAALEQYKSEGP